MKRDQPTNRIAHAFMVFSLLLGIGLVLAPTARAQDQDDRYNRDRDNGNQSRRGRDWDRYGNYGGSAELRRAALNAGYDEGVREGRKDRGNGSRTEHRNLSSYQKALKGYNPRFGDRELYRRYFREGFEDGYNAESYNRDYRDRSDRNDTRRDRDDNRRDRDDNRRDRDDNDRDRNDNGYQRPGRNEDGYGNFGGSFQLRQTALNAGFGEGVKQGREDRRRRNADGYQSQSTYRQATKDYSSRLGDREVYQRYFREAYEHGYADGYSGH